MASIETENQEIDCEKLLEAIELRGLKICHVADHVGISRNTMSRLVNGYTTPTLEVIKLISSFLKLSGEEILTIFHRFNLKRGGLI